MTDRYVIVDGPVWPLIVAFGEAGVTGAGTADHPGDFEEAYAARTGRLVERATSAPRPWARPLAEALATGRLGDLPVDLSSLTPFQQEVLRATAAIPPGEVRTYGELAAEVGRPGAGRAVGMVMARNPIPILVPCHRVVRSGGLGQYGLGGPAAKQRLLDWEQALVAPA